MVLTGFQEKAEVKPLDTRLGAGTPLALLCFIINTSRKSSPDSKYGEIESTS